jgi:hypothetical protein
MEVVIMEDRNYKIILTLPERLKSTLKSEAGKKALSVNAFIRTLIADHLNNIEKEENN